MRIPFKDAPDKAVVTCSHVLEDGADISYVYHDEDDSCWQFLCSEHIQNPSFVRVITLKEMYEHDNSIKDLAYLPEGGFAKRISKAHPWEIELHHTLGAEHVDLTPLTNLCIFKNGDIEKISNSLSNYASHSKGSNSSLVSYRIANIKQSPEWIVVMWDKNPDLDEDLIVEHIQNVTFNCTNPESSIKSADFAFVAGFESKDPVFFAKLNEDEKHGTASLGMYKNQPFHYNLISHEMDLDSQIVPSFDMIKYLKEQILFDLTWLVESDDYDWKSCSVEFKFD